MPANSPTVQPLWRRWLYRFGISLGLALFLYQAVQGWTAFHGADACLVRPGYLGLGIGLYLVGYGVLMAAWGVIMRGQGVHLRPRAILEGYMLAALPRYIPGSVWGYLSRGEWLARYHGVSYEVSTLTSIMEAGVQVVTAIGLGAVLIAPAPWNLLVAGLSLAAVWLIWVVTPAVWQRVRGHAVAPATNGWWWVAALYAVFWSFQGGALLATHHALCAAVPLRLDHSIAAASLAWAAGFLVLFVPAGLGVREWALSALLALLAGVAAGQSHLVAAGCRLLQIVAELIALGIGLHGALRAWWSKRNGLSSNVPIE